MSSALLASSELRVLLGTLAKAALSGAKTVMALPQSRVSTKPGFFHRRNQGGKDRVIAGRHGHRGSGHTGEAAGDWLLGTALQAAPKSEVAPCDGRWHR